MPYVIMRDALLGAAKRFGIGFKDLVVAAVAVVIAGATSDTTINAVTTAGGGLKSAGSTTGRILLSKIGELFPRARKAVVVGGIQGFNVFKAQFNRNGANAVQSTRNKLTPLDKISAIASIVTAVVLPLVGASMLIGTYVVFYKDPEKLPLTVFSTDAGIESVLGIGTAIVVNVFKFVGALDAAVSWVLSQLN
ncbi:hypothetical protein [Halosimplex sp. J119]